MRDFLTKRGAPVAALLLSLCVGSAGAQVLVQSRPGTEVPKEKVTLLFNATCRVVAEEFRLRDAAEVRVPVTLVVGEGRDGVVGDETTEVFTIYMSRWDETMFATSVSRIALQHLLSGDRKARIVRESLRRAQLAAPASVRELISANHQSVPAANFDSKSASSPAALTALPCVSSASPFPAERDGRPVRRSGPLCQTADALAP